MTMMISIGRSYP